MTALQAVEEMDAGPIWGSRTFPLPSGGRKSAVYNGPVADAAIELIGEVVAKAADPSFTPEPLDYTRPDVTGQLRPAMRAVDREFSWSDPTETILRHIGAGDGSPGVPHHPVRHPAVGVRRPSRTGPARGAGHGRVAQPRRRAGAHR